MNFLKNSSIALVVASLLFGSSLIAATESTTSVDITVGETVVLYYATDLTVDMSAKIIAMANGITKAGTGSFSFENNRIEYSARVSEELSANADKYSLLHLKIGDAWAVSAITSNPLKIDITETGLDATYDDGTTTHKIVLNKAEISLLDDASIETSLNLVTSGLDPANAVKGDVHLTIDISGAGAAGTYSGISYTLKVDHQ